MRHLAHLISAVVLAGAVSTSSPAGLPDSWPAAGDRSAIDWKKLAAEVPAEVRPALDLTQAYINALDGRPAEQWRPRILALISDPSVPRGIVEAARMWEARVRMADIRGALKIYFRKKVAFPPDIGEVIGQVPESSRQDPWDRPWQYRLTAPAGLPKLQGKDYELYPAGIEGLVPIHQLVRAPFTPPEIKFERIEVGNSPGVKIQRASGTPAILQAGGSIDGLHLIQLDSTHVLWCQYGFFFITR